MTPRDGDEIVKVIKMLDILLLEYKQEEIDYPVAVDDDKYAFYQGRKAALIELKRRYLENLR